VTRDELIDALTAERWGPMLPTPERVPSPAELLYRRQLLVKQLSKRVVDGAVDTGEDG
jgi:hypothetical protein